MAENQSRQEICRLNHSPEARLEQFDAFGGECRPAIQQLKQQDGPVLQVSGSSRFLQTLLSHDLVDELYLYICPITLGIGKRLFAEGTIPAAFTLREVKASPRGVIIASYERAGDVQTG